MEREIDNTEFNLIDKIKLLKRREKNNPTPKNKDELKKATKALSNYRAKKCNG